MTLSGDEWRFQLATNAARSIVKQCLNHADSATKKLHRRVNSASASSTHGQDLHAAVNGRYMSALRQRVSVIEATANGIVSNLRGLHILTSQDTFYPLPAVSVVRSIAEISASTAWLLRGDVSIEDRAARSYATMFRSLEKGITGSLESDSERITRMRELLVSQVQREGATVVRKRRGDIEFRQVVQVTVRKAHAKVEFQYSRRIAEEIPKIGDLYPGLSGTAHGEPLHLSTSWETPDSFARLIGRVTQRSVQAWSRAVHSWVGVEYAPFVNRGDVADLLASMPDEYLAEFGSPDLDD